MVSETQTTECSGPNLRILTVFLLLAGLAALIASGLRAAHAEEAAGAVAVQGASLHPASSWSL